MSETPFGIIRSGNASSTETPAVSVVIPALNEEHHIGLCLNSVFDAFHDGPSFEVILVDSNSSDRTVEIARKYPITILQITDDELASPGAGRYIGTKAATGEQILFVDADMEITDGWIRDAYEMIKNEEDVSGVGGFLGEAGTTTARSVNAIHGVMLYDSKVLDEVGTFDPFLHGYEDIWLGFKMKDQGCDLIQLPTVTAVHLRPYELSQLSRRWQSGYLLGLGQVFRESLSSPRLTRMLLYRNLSLISLSILFVAGVISFVVNRALFLRWLLLASILFVADALWKGPSYAVERWVRSAISGVGFYRGFVMELKDPSEFPLDRVDVITQGEQYENSRNVMQEATQL